MVRVSYSKAKNNGPAGLSFHSSSPLFPGAAVSQPAYAAPSANTHPPHAASHDSLGITHNDALSESGASMGYGVASIAAAAAAPNDTLNPTRGTL